MNAPSNANTSGLAEAWARLSKTFSDRFYEGYEPEIEAMSAAVVTAASAQARIAELEAELSQANANGASHWSRATAAEARNAEVSMLAYRWMEAHDRLKAGLDYDLPTPADLPNEKARADRLAKGLKDARDQFVTIGAESTDESVRLFARGCADSARAALKQETQP